MSFNPQQYESQLEETMLSDRHRLRQRLRQLQRARKNEKRFESDLSMLVRQLESSRERAQQRRLALPQPKFADDLPINTRIEEIKEAIENHQVMIVCGETGSGKSTQLPKICLEMGRGVYGVIGHTQPRRLAARSVATRIAEELGSSVGEYVGFKIRFTDTTQPTTYVKLMTDGVMLAETQRDRFLNQYDTIIIDEAHERSLNIDFLLGYIKRILPQRPELRLIITSATIDAARFSEHFTIDGQPAPVLNIEGRTYPVELRYRPPEKDEESGDFDWRTALTNAVDEISMESEGDILTFLPTEREIREAAKVLRGHLTRTMGTRRTLEVLPLYGRLSEKEQQKIFQPHGNSRIVLATNVAESSLTVPGIKSVIDLGTARISRYSARSKMQRLPIEPVSKASANQRKGRCGRIAPGICIRLYSEKDFDSREDFTPPEIQRTNLAQVILQTISLKLGAIEQFPFLDPPRGGMIRDGYKTLYELGAIDDQQQLTEIGRQLARLPVDPRIGRMILAGHDEQCLNEILIIASVLEIQDPRDRPVEFQQAADKAHEQFQHESSDFLSYLKLWDFYLHIKQDLSNSKFRHACRQNFLNMNRLREWSDIHRQLLQLVREANLPVEKRRDNEDAIHRALMTGLLSNIAFLDDKKEYVGSGGTKRFLWPGSGLFSKKPKWVMSAEVIETSQRFARTCARINPAWIEPLAKHLVKLTQSEPHWDRDAGAALAWEKVTLFGMTIIPRRRVPLGRTDPDLARELMIRDGLTLGDIDTQGDFLAHNLQVIEDVRGLQAKVRRQDYGTLEQTIMEFYEEKIPNEIYDVARFEKWRKSAEEQEPKLLYLDVNDFIEHEEESLDRQKFPDALVFENLRLPLSYQLQPGEEEDGVTVTVSQSQLPHLQQALLDWLVPGLLGEKIAALIKSLPKSVRTKLVPAPDTAREVVAKLKYGQGAFLNTVAESLTRIAGETVSASDFDLSALTDYLRMNIRVTDESGAILGSSRDLDLLKKKHGLKIQANSNSSAPQKSVGPAFDVLAKESKWHRDGLTTWDFEDLLETITLSRGDYVVTGYPALFDAGQHVNLRVYSSVERANAATRQGLYRLFLKESQSKVKHQVDHFPNIDQLEMLGTAHQPFAKLRGQLMHLIAARAFAATLKLPRTQAEYRQFLTTATNRITVAVQDVANVIGPIAKLYRELIKEIEDLKAPSWQYAQQDLRQQLELLFPANVLMSQPWEGLMHYERYLQGMKVRSEKLKNAGLEKDRRAYAELEPYWRRTIEAVTSKQANDPEVIAFRWMVEEYRVSLFAQQLGTSQAVSPKRLDRQWKKATR
ncbi:ATP-dependent RNA helicase HrpA [Rubinisphaera sp.]|uniref:ATP-dependent RNA helicase HrpA n=1 Tax=Rubinisphaera sp. TaxID=2024857 RepID=UPI000C0FDD07|nr:ATP-dependent RNA helicase HrpA [Rubinisphaera sp.]MBV08325.1 ATP-dependent RNA helicase HrpA [Rubinisphaera sp.]HCS52641.1 ATP-dependent RNA helicase HrpA [Planctomycetaceae bacterium]|tara:strand:+ start:20760 stop:24701 length:3942 start_codon:yes stop_codon:yes gene_type:complete